MKTSRIPTFERSQISNQLGVNRADSLIAEGVHDGYSWRMGIYSNDTPINTVDPVTKMPTGAIRDGAFGRFNGGFSYSFGAGYDIVPDLIQLVGRYSYAQSEGPEGLVASPRYDQMVSTSKGRGDTYHTIYGGLQYFIHGDQLKLMAGVEWGLMKNSAAESFSGVTLLSGVRFSF